MAVADSSGLGSTTPTQSPRYRRSSPERTRIPAPSFERCSDSVLANRRVADVPTARCHERAGSDQCGCTRAPKKPIPTGPASEETPRSRHTPSPRAAALARRNARQLPPSPRSGGECVGASGDPPRALSVQRHQSATYQNRPFKSLLFVTTGFSGSSPDYPDRRLVVGAAQRLPNFNRG